MAELVRFLLVRNYEYSQITEIPDIRLFVQGQRVRSSSVSDLSHVGAERDNLLSIDRSRRRRKRRIRFACFFERRTAAGREADSEMQRGREAARKRRNKGSRRRQAHLTSRKNNRGTQPAD